MPEAAESLDPAPLVIECGAREISSPDERIYFGRRCSTTYYSVSETMVIRYSFYDGDHPMETWGSLDASVRAFVRSLVMDDSQ